MFSERFNKEIILTNHAKKRMRERNISGAELLSIIETGNLKFKDETHLWAFKFFENRNDNLICAVLVAENCIVVKTVMFHFAF